MGAWIEIVIEDLEKDYPIVAPYVGAWIEIGSYIGDRLEQESLPMWERGLKYGSVGRSAKGADVAPYVGAWIEIFESVTKYENGEVAPYVGAWIEMHNCAANITLNRVSLPLWERGLKLTIHEILNRSG